MPTHAPVVNQWYRQLDKELEFQVTAVDEEAGTVEMQYLDGDLEEVDLETWSAFELKPIAPPDAWSGAPLDDAQEDLGYDDLTLPDDDWSGSLGEHDHRLFGDGEDDESRW